ncbi:transcription antitermination factor NusB [Caminibacter mediatlanticus TB-2]|uniref:Transcription antitermination protein NusB n=1 Tax=Caminibacter mediatlanticus TB-2 TaxID=391592 RepID=A0ABX5VB64_9BACT|nr:transcription antitermination factor NusB [Caminibacter mediatlanticus]QCT93836.1 transcription antitermination factor NusB [Caminibacter mediatlanticus TB-2]
MATITHAREAVIQTLYAKELGNDDAINQFDELLKERKIKGQKAEFAKKLLNGILEHINEIDEIIKNHLIDWSFDRLDKVDKQILRTGIYEIKYTDTPYQIVIDEAVKIAKNFSEDKSKNFINGILDKVAKEVRENK